jgi:hypothetical protein
MVRSINPTNMENDAVTDVDVDVDVDVDANVNVGAVNAWPERNFHSLNEILPGKLWLGSFAAIRDRSILATFSTPPVGITATLNVAMEVTYPRHALDTCRDADIGVHKVSLRDEEDYIVQHMQHAVHLLHALIDEQKRCVFVHCHMGVSRSPAVVIAYLVHHRAMNANDAFALVRSKRVIARRDETFLARLGKR